jgi:hypothetical protein
MIATSSNTTSCQHLPTRIGNSSQDDPIGIVTTEWPVKLKMMLWSRLASSYDIGSPSTSMGDNA